MSEEGPQTSAKGKEGLEEEAAEGTKGHRKHWQRPDDDKGMNVDDGGGVLVPCSSFITQKRGNRGYRN